MLNVVIQLGNVHDQVGPSLTTDYSLSLQSITKSQNNDAVAVPVVPCPCVAADHAFGGKTLMENNDMHSISTPGAIRSTSYGDIVPKSPCMSVKQCQYQLGLGADIETEIETTPPSEEGHFQLPKQICDSGNMPEDISVNNEVEGSCNTSLSFPSPADQHGSRNTVRLSQRCESPISMASRNAVVHMSHSIGLPPVFQSIHHIRRRRGLGVAVLGVKGEAFCDCLKQQTQPNGDMTENDSRIPPVPKSHLWPVPTVGPRYLNCLCGEETKVHEWGWDSGSCSRSCEIAEDGHHVYFNKEYSAGTAAVRGTRQLVTGQHFWEIKMTSPVYGSDMMVGIGSPEVELQSKEDEYCSFLGLDGESWGLSYTGHFYHEGSHVKLAPPFGKGSIMGIHLDMWHGTLSFYKNRQFVGIAANGLRGRRLYPMACSTAGQSTMKLINTTSFPSSLKFLSCSALRRYVPDHFHVLEVLPIPPGLRDSLDRQLHWLLRPHNGKSSTSASEQLPSPAAEGRAARGSSTHGCHSKRSSGSVPDHLGPDSPKKKCIETVLRGLKTSE